MKECDPVLLRRVQQTELTILNDFIALCQDRGLTYFVFAGLGIEACVVRALSPGTKTST